MIEMRVCICDMCVCAWYVCSMCVCVCVCVYNVGAYVCVCLCVCVCVHACIRCTCVYDKGGTFLLWELSNNSYPCEGRGVAWLV